MGTGGGEVILNFSNEVDRIISALGAPPVSSKQELAIAMILAEVMSRGMGQERKRCLEIVARKAMNAAAVREEISRPVR